MPDLRFANHGTIWLMRPETPDGQHWVEEHIPEDAQRFGYSVAIEPRYVEAIVQGAVEDGLTVSM